MCSLIIMFIRFLHMDMKLYDKAEKYYKRALAVDPSHVRILSDYGMFLYVPPFYYVHFTICLSLLLLRHIGMMMK